MVSLEKSRFRQWTPISGKWTPGSTTFSNFDGPVVTSQLIWLICPIGQNIWDLKKSSHCVTVVRAFSNVHQDLCHRRLKGMMRWDFLTLVYLQALALASQLLLYRGEKNIPGATIHSEAAGFALIKCIFLSTIRVKNVHVKEEQVGCQKRAKLGPNSYLMTQPSGTSS